MRIGIDARFYGVTGIGRYVKNLIKELENLDLENEYLIFLRKGGFEDYQPKNSNFSKVLVDYSWYGFKEQLFMPFAIFVKRVDLMHFPHFNIPIFWFGKFVLTLHDLTHFQHSTAKGAISSKFFYFTKKLVYLGVVYFAAWRSRKILVPSKDVKKDVVKKLKVKPDKVLVTYEGVDAIFDSNKLAVNDYQSTLNKYKIRKPYLLYVGAVYPHKNIERLLQAFLLITRYYKYSSSPLFMNLVIVSKVGNFLKNIKTKVNDLGLSNNVFLPGFLVPDGYVPDKDLKILYRNAKAYIFPSLKEGFGIPILEAWASNLPIVGSGISCIPEIGGDAVLYFNPYSVEDMAEKTKRVIGDKKLREDLRKRGSERLKKFSWGKMAEETFRVYSLVGST